MRRNTQRFSSYHVQVLRYRSAPVFYHAIAERRCAAHPLSLIPSTFFLLFRAFFSVIPNAVRNPAWMLHFAQLDSQFNSYPFLSVHSLNFNCHTTTAPASRIFSLALKPLKLAIFQRALCKVSPALHIAEVLLCKNKCCRLCSRLFLLSIAG